MSCPKCLGFGYIPNSSADAEICDFCRGSGNINDDKEKGGEEIGNNG